MTQVRSLTREGQAEIRAAVLAWLGLDARHVRGDLRTVHHGEPYPVVVEWQGSATMTIQQWEDLVAAVDAGEYADVGSPEPGDASLHTLEGLSLTVADLVARVAALEDIHNDPTGSV